MAGRNVVWTRTADMQFVGILEYWVHRNKSNTYSKKLVSLVSKTTKQIAENPNLFKATNYKDIRVAPLNQYSIFYKTYSDQIIILAFWDNRQDDKKLLQYLKTRNK